MDILQGREIIYLLLNLTQGYSLPALNVTSKGSVTPISDQELQVVTNDISDIRRNNSVVFTVTAPPKLGQLVRRMPDNSTQNIAAFTQSMVGSLHFAYLSVPNG